MWYKLVTRRIAVQISIAWNYGFGKDMIKTYGLGVFATLVFYDGKKSDYYTDLKEMETYWLKLNILLGKKSFIKGFYEEAKRNLEIILRNTRILLKGDLTELSNRELTNIYRRFLPWHTQFYVRMWTVFLIGDPLASIVRKHLARKIKNEKILDELILTFSSPLKPNDVLNERKDILKIAKQKSKLSKEKFLKKIEKHTKKYQHIPMFDFDHSPYTKDHFLDEIKKIKNPQKELKEINKLFTHRNQDFRRELKKLKPNKELRNLLKMLKDMVYLRDYRDMLRQKLNLTIRKLYQEIGQRLGLTLEKSAYLTNQEIINYLRDNKKFFQKEVKKRANKFLLIQKGDRIRLYSGSIVLEKAREGLGSAKKDRLSSFKGKIGAKGKAKGRVRIVYTNKDLYKVKEGEILVATMTRQDFVAAIRKSKAIITDEGGVTCHAAIISRELKIPCVVGTKIATNVLKDGDLVEVDAFKGIVRKLK